MAGGTGRRGCLSNTRHHRVVGDEPWPPGVASCSPVQVKCTRESRGLSTASFENFLNSLKMKSRECWASERINPDPQDA